MCWHKWTKWEAYKWVGHVTAQWGKAAGQAIPCEEFRQKRHCEKCGKMQDEEILGS